MKIDRLVSILMMLINKKKVTAKELSEYFEVSVRTIQRDMETLDMAGVPIYADVGKNGGYQLLDSFKMNKNYISIDEGKLLISVLESLQDILPKDDVKSFYNKVVSLVPENEAESKLVVRLNPAANNPFFKQNLNILAKARDEQKQVAITYVDANLKKSKRVIEPHTLVMLGPIWYIYCYCCLRNGFRMFKLSRIEECEITQESFQRKEINETLPWNMNYDSGRAGTKIVIELDISQKDKIPEYIDYRECRIIEDKIIAEMNFPVDEWVYSMLMGMVPYVKILEPQWVKDEFVNRLKASIEKNC